MLNGIEPLYEALATALIQVLCLCTQLDSEVVAWDSNVVGDGHEQPTASVLHSDSPRARQMFQAS